LLPVGSRKNKFLEFFIIFSGNGSAALHSMFSKTFARLDDNPLRNNLIRLEEEIECHSAISLVLRLAKCLSFFNNFFNNLGRWLRALELSLFFRFLLGKD